VAKRLPGLTHPAILLDADEPDLRTEEFYRPLFSSEASEPTSGDARPASVGSVDLPIAHVSVDREPGETVVMPISPLLRWQAGPQDLEMTVPGGRVPVVDIVQDELSSVVANLCQVQRMLDRHAPPAARAALQESIERLRRLLSE
jgi:hypothetical protein